MDREYTILFCKKDRLIVFRIKAADFKVTIVSIKERDGGLRNGNIST